MRAHRALRVTTVLAVAAAMSFIGVQSASAAVSGTITGYTTAVSLKFEGNKTVGASLITLKTLDGDELLTYCIDLNTHTGPGVTYDEGTWAEAQSPEPKRRSGTSPIWSTSTDLCRPKTISRTSAGSTTICSMWQVTRSPSLFPR